MTDHISTATAVLQGRERDEEGNFGTRCKPSAKGTASATGALQGGWRNEGGMPETRCLMERSEAPVPGGAPRGRYSNSMLRSRRPPHAALRLPRRRSGCPGLVELPAVNEAFHLAPFSACHYVSITPCEGTSPRIASYSTMHHASSTKPSRRVTTACITHTIHIGLQPRCVHQK